MAANVVKSNEPTPRERRDAEPVETPVVPEAVPDPAVASAVAVAVALTPVAETAAAAVLAVRLGATEDADGVANLAANAPKPIWLLS